jgi:putative addiction module component (TIGR02574 family)
MTAVELRNAALALPRDERVALAHELLVSLDDEPTSEAAQAWLDELGRRADQVASGTSALSSWDEARDRIAARLKARRETRAPR